MSRHVEGNECLWEFMVVTLEEQFYMPDVQAARALYAAIAAHDLTNGQPVWPMLVAPPGSAKTSILEPLNQFGYVHPIDKLTPNTFLSGQIGQQAQGRKPSLLHRIGPSGIVIFPDFSTVLAMKPDDRAAILADLRRIFDGQLRKEVGTAGQLLQWNGRITCAVAVTPDIDRHYSVFQSLGERFVMIRWHRPGGEQGAEYAAIHAMNQDPAAVRQSLKDAAEVLFEGPLPADISVPDQIQGRIAALAEFVVRGRTHVARGNDKRLIYVPEAEAPTRLAQQLCQLARGSARLSRRSTVNESDVSLIARVGFDCIPSLRWRLLQSYVTDTTPHDEDIARSTRSYGREDLAAVGLLKKTRQEQTYELSRLAAGLLKRMRFTEYPLRTSTKKIEEGIHLVERGAIS